MSFTVPTTEVEVNGRVWKVTRLRTAHGAKANKWVNQIKGGSSRVRCASTNGVTNATCNTALGDVGAESGSRKVYIA